MVAIEVRRVRRDEAEVLRGIRLAALKDEPSAFAKTYEEEVAYPSERWAAQAGERSDGSTHATFFAVDDGSVVGLVGGHRNGDLVELVSMWTERLARGRGVGAALVEAVVEWADGDPVELWVTRGNDPAFGLYERCGFVETGGHRPLPSDPCKGEIRMRRAPG